MKTSYLNDWNADLLDEYYQRWKQDPASVDSSWSAFFEGFELGSSGSRNGKPDVVPAREGELPISTGLQDRSTAWFIIIVFSAIPRPRWTRLAQARPETPALTLAGFGFGGCAARYDCFIPLFSAIALDDPRRDDRHAPRHLLRADRSRVHAYSERDGPRMGPGADGSKDHFASTRCGLLRKGCCAV